MPAAMVSIAQATLGYAAPSISFGGLPQTYRDLRLVVNGTTVSGGALFLTLNSDTANNYSWVRMLGDGSTTASSANSSYGFIYVGDIGATANLTLVTSDILDYSATDKHKTVLSRSNIPNQYVFALASRWASTSAVTRIDISSSGGNFNTGTTFELFGILG